MPLFKIISGAQTAIDRGALDAALELGFPCGGACLQDRVAEDGRIPDGYPVIELNAGKYRARTIRNVLDSDGTLIIYFSSLSGDTEQTVAHCIKKRKPYQLIDAIEECRRPSRQSTCQRPELLVQRGGGGYSTDRARDAASGA